MEKYKIALSLKVKRQILCFMHAHLLGVFNNGKSKAVNVLVYKGTVMYYLAI